MKSLNKLALTAATGTALGAAVFGYGALIETRRFRVRHEILPVLPATSGAVRLRILHVADSHLVPGRSVDKAKSEFTRSLAELEPDLVVNTGDNLGAVDAVEPLLESMEPLLDFPGIFVPGSNDYFGPKPANPLRYLAGPSNRKTLGELNSGHTQSGSPTVEQIATLEDRVLLDYQGLFTAFEEHGWVNLTDRSQLLTLTPALATESLTLAVAGTNDAHLNLDRWPGFPQQAAEDAAQPDLRIALTHAPYQRVLNELTGAGADLIFAGHTHGGQICLPFFGAVVTNCDLPQKYAAGLFRWNAEGQDSWVNVSAGLGAAPTMPVRVACRPEAVVIDLVPAATE